MCIIPLSFALFGCINSAPSDEDVLNMYIESSRYKGNSYITSSIVSKECIEKEHEKKHDFDKEFTYWKCKTTIKIVQKATQNVGSGRINPDFEKNKTVILSLRNLDGKWAKI